MVYCGGLENRFGGNADGGSNPSLSARLHKMANRRTESGRPVKFVNNLTKLGIWVILIGAAFAFAWWKGYLLKLSGYLQQTKEELKKCTWPTWDELKGSTVLIAVSIVALGAFTVVVDYVFVHVVIVISKV